MTNSMRLLVILLASLFLSCAETRRPKNTAAAAQAGETPEAYTGGGSAVAAAKELAEWRERIDAADRELVALLNRRAGYVLRLAPLKRQIGVEVRDPGREEQVLQNLSEANQGPLPDESLHNIYRSILSAMRDLQSRD